MPIFTQMQEKEAGKKKVVPQETVDQYKQFVEQLQEGNVGHLEFGQDEDISPAKAALQEAGTQLGIHLKVNKVRGRDNILRFKRISPEEFEEAQKKAKERGARMKGKTRAKKK